LIAVSSEAERKELIRAATAAFVVGNSWAFARRIRNRVKGPRVNVKDLTLIVKDCYLKVKALPRLRYLTAVSSEAERKALIRAATAAFAVGNSWAFARRIQN